MLCENKMLMPSKCLHLLVLHLSALIQGAYERPVLSARLFLFITRIAEPDIILLKRLISLNCS